MSTLLKLKNIEKTYTSRGAQPVRALTNISFTVEAGEFVAIMGESGSGKSTLLNLIATLDDPTGGDISLNGQDLISPPWIVQRCNQNLARCFQNLIHP